MKPLPEAVQQAFPCASDRLPERPWWRRAGGQFLRDGMGGLSRPLNDVLLEDHDAKNPIPHPGYRAGQVWADEDGGSIVIVAVHIHAVKPLQTANDLAGWLEWEFARAYPYLMADPACPHLAPWSPAEVKS